MTVTFEQAVGASAVFLFLAIIARVCWSPRGMSEFIDALNVLNSPYIAILVMFMGMVFDIVSQKYGVSNDAATGVIGAGVGMLTSQAIAKASSKPSNPPNLTITDTREEPPK